ncbi:MAG: hypothetical protein LUB59_03910 [Candidatus Gastranaerophilales bacterium]|nr:hypothetical protein [Candidatus Gastranaerophilales bacterium]
MRIDAINLGAFTGTTQIQTLKADESGTTNTDEFDDTRIAQQSLQIQPVSSPIEKEKGTIEDLMSMQASTEKMAHSYGFADLEQAAGNSVNNTNSVSAVSSSGGMEFRA